MNRSDFHKENYACLKFVLLDVALKHLVPLLMDLLGPYTNHLHMPRSRTPEGLE